MSTVLFISSIRAVLNSITLPPEGDTLSGPTLEHPIVAVPLGEVGLWRGKLRIRGYITILLITPVHTVGLAITVPGSEYTVMVVTTELPVLTRGVYSAVVFVCSPGTIIISITSPGGGETGSSCIQVDICLPSNQYQPFLIPPNPKNTVLSFMLVKKCFKIPS